MNIGDASDIKAALESIDPMELVALGGIILKVKGNVQGAEEIPGDAATLVALRTLLDAAVENDEAVWATSSSQISSGSCSVVAGILEQCELKSETKADAWRQFMGVFGPTLGELMRRKVEELKSTSADRYNDLALTAGRPRESETHPGELLPTVHYSTYIFECWIIFIKWSEQPPLIECTAKEVATVWYKAKFGNPGRLIGTLLFWPFALISWLIMKKVQSGLRKAAVRT